MAKHPAAVALGTLGGRARSEKKAEAVRLNGRLGGRPRKPKEDVTMNQVKGKCVPCKVIYVWSGKPRLREALCPECRAELVLTSSLSKLPRITDKHPLLQVERHLVKNT
jgi:hypothetical protein